MTVFKDRDINPRWLSVTQACKYASMSDKTLMRHVHAGAIRGPKRGGKRYIDRYSIDAFFLVDDDIYVEETLARLSRKIT